jgi:hypothetical protein
MGNYFYPTNLLAETSDFSTGAAQGPSGSPQIIAL